MAELLVNVGSLDLTDPLCFQDGDVIEAWNDERIGYCHGSKIVCPKYQPMTNDGLRESPSMVVESSSIMYKKRFDRLSKTELLVTPLDGTGPPYTIRNTPDAQGRYIHLELFLAARLSRSTHRIFGTPGSEFWFGGGYQPRDDTKLTAIWASIELHSPHRRVDYSLAPLAKSELARHLALRVTNMTNAEVEAFTAVEDDRYMDRGKQIEERAQIRSTRVDWRSHVSGRTVTDAEKRGRVVDHRNNPPMNTTVIAQPKARRGRDEWQHSP